MSSETVIETDVLVIGGGIAGCFAAIKAKDQGVDVTLVDRGYVGKTGQTPGAGNMVVFNPEMGHDLDDWMNQVRVVGEYMNNPDYTEITFKESYARFQDLLSWGAQFYKYEDGGYQWRPYGPPEELAKAPMQCIRHPRRKNAEVLRAQAVKTGVKIMDRIMITDLLKQDGKIAGAIGFSVGSYDSYIFKAKATIMAAGTASFKLPTGRALAHSTGDGEAMAYRAGCEITGKEWQDGVAFGAELHRRGPRIDNIPTVKPSHPEPPYLVYDVEGVELGAGLGYPWVHASYTAAIAAHAGRAPIFQATGQADATRRVVRSPGPEGYPRQEVDLEAEKKGLVRVVQGQNMGQSVHVSEGIWPINTKCATQLPGLYAAGESLGARACGSRYPDMGFASPTCAVQGARAGLAAAEYALQAKKPEVDKEEVARLKKIMYAPAERKGGFGPSWVTQVLQTTMAPYWVLYVKHEKRLQATLSQIEFMRDHIVPKLTANDPHELRLAIETKNVILSAEMKLRASLFRTESRGSHYREDYPRRDDPTWLAWVKIKEEQGQMKLSKEPIPEKWWPDLSKPYEERYPVRYAGE